MVLIADTTFVVYSDLYQKARLSVVVRAFPGFVDVLSAFVWKRVTGAKITNVLVTSVSQGHDIFMSEMLIDPVNAVHYGEYIVTVNNTIKAPLTINVELRPRGKCNIL